MIDKAEVIIDKIHEAVSLLFLLPASLNKSLNKFFSSLFLF